MGTTGTSGRGQGAARPKPGPNPRPKPGVSAKVYRRRRLVAGLLALLVIAAVVAGGVFLVHLLTNNSSDAAAGAVTSASTAAAAGETAPAVEKTGSTPSAVCDEGGIKVVASVDKPSYGPDEEPVLTLRVTNSGQAPCDINVGTSQMEYEITSGEDTIFNSKDCQLEPTDLVRNLAPGASETANFVWPVKRSTAGCGKVEAEPGRDGATYGFVATLGKWSSEKVTFTLQ